LEIEKAIKEEVKKEVTKGDSLVWLLIYDFTEVKNNSAKVRMFYRKIKNIEDGSRKTDSEIVFQNLEDALRVKELASSCGAKVSLYGGVEL